MTAMNLASLTGAADQLGRAGCVVVTTNKLTVLAA